MPCHSTLGNAKQRYQFLPRLPFRTTAHHVRIPLLCVGRWQRATLLLRSLCRERYARRTLWVRGETREGRDLCHSRQMRRDRLPAGGVHTPRGRRRTAEPDSGSCIRRKRSDRGDARPRLGRRCWLRRGVKVGLGIATCLRGRCRCVYARRPSTGDGPWSRPFWAYRLRWRVRRLTSGCLGLLRM